MPPSRMGWCKLHNHRDTYLEQQQTEKIEVERRRKDTNHKSVRLLSRVAFWGGHKSAPVGPKHMLSPQLSAPH
jgi:hypothetical protein